jgi:hypothetical protein
MPNPRAQKPLTLELVKKDLMTFKEPFMALADQAAGGMRGMTLATLGLPGEVESLSRSAVNAMLQSPSPRAISSRGQAAPQISDKTLFPTMDELSKKFDPAIPKGVPNQKSRERSADYGETFGQFGVLPGTTGAVKLATYGVGRGAGALTRAGAKAINDANLYGKGPLAAVTPQVQNIVKSGGGNWLRQGLDEQRTLGDAGDGRAQSIWARQSDDYKAQYPHREQLAVASDTVADWANKNMRKYMANQMGTKDDPVRKLAEQDISHFGMRPDEFGEYPFIKPTPETKKLRAEHAVRTWEPTTMADSSLAQYWENLSDNAIKATTVGDIKNAPKAGYSFKAKEDIAPYADKVPPETPIYNIDTGDNYQTARQSLGFNRLLDVMKEDIAAGRITPKEVSAWDMEQAVRHVDKRDKAIYKAEAEEADRLTKEFARYFPTLKEYPDNSRWIELKVPDLNDLPKEERLQLIDKLKKEAIEKDIDPEQYVEDYPRMKLEEALKHEGEKMGHCVGSYCEDVITGKSRVISYRDANGDSHVTLEITPNENPYGATGSGFVDLPIKTRTEYENIIRQWRRNNPDVEYLTDADINRALKEAGVEPRPDEIKQIKGKQDARPVEKYIPYVQDFQRMTKYPIEGDFENSGFIKHPSGKYFTKQEAQGLFNKHFGEEPVLGGETPESYYRRISRYEPDMLTDMDKGFIEDYKAGNFPKFEDDLSEGGAVHMSDNPDTMRMELQNQRYAGGGIVRGLKQATKRGKLATTKLDKPIADIKTQGTKYATKQEGPFYRVNPASVDVSKAKSRGIREANELQGKPSVGATAREVGSQNPLFISEEELAGLVANAEANEPLKIAQRYTKEKQGSDFSRPEISESSLAKQSAIGRAHQLAIEGSPEYKQVVFDAYAKQMPNVLEQAGAKNYDDLMEKAYRQLAQETDEQFEQLPFNFSYHRAGEGDYRSSKEMMSDVHGNRHLYVFQGGDPHDFLNQIDKSTGLNENEKFRAVHDLLGHAIYGNQFGPKGEEVAWAIHQQMYSPLARLAMTAETRGQNSLVNYSPLNAGLKAEIAKLEDLAEEARRRRDMPLMNEINKAKREIFSGFQFAPQKAVLLPPEFVDPKYAGGMPEYLSAANKPTKGTETESVLTHFSHSPDLELIDPTKYGTGIKGAEAERLRDYAGGVTDRSYFYLGEPGTVTPESGLGIHRYRGESSNLYDITQDPLQFRTLAREANRTPFTARVNAGVTSPMQEANDYERMVKEYGYEGMINPNASKPMGIMFKPTPVESRKVGGSVRLSNNPDSMMMELNNKKFAMGGAVGENDVGSPSPQNSASPVPSFQVGGAVKGLAALKQALTGGKKAATAAKAAEAAYAPGVHYADPLQPPTMRMSEALGISGSEGKTLNFTEADRSRVFGENMGGVGFSGLQHYSAPHKKANVSWGFGNEKIAQRKTKQGDPEKTVWTTYIGSPEQHKSNTIVVKDALKTIQAANKQGIVHPEQIKIINQRLQEVTNKKGNSLFPKDFDITDPAALNYATTFERRAAISDTLMGLGVKDPMRSKAFKETYPGVKWSDAADVENILKRETEPSLIGLENYSVGPHLFTMDGGVVLRPDLNIAFPAQTTGTDFGLRFKAPSMREAAPDWIKEKGYGPKDTINARAMSMGAPTQFVDEKYLTNLQKSGNKAGGAVKANNKYSSGGALPALMKHAETVRQSPLMNYQRK